MYETIIGPNVLKLNEIIRELGWKPAMRFDEGLRITVEWFRKKWKNELPTMKR